MNKIKNMIHALWRRVLNPVESFQSDLALDNLIFLKKKVLPFLLVFSSISIFALYPIGIFKNDVLSLFYNVFFSTFILFPLIVALFTMPFHWSARSIGGNGKFLDHLKLNTLSFFNFIKGLFIISFFLSLIVGLGEARWVYDFFLAFSLVVLLFYFSVATKAVHMFTWARTLTSFGLVGFFITLVYFSSFILSK